MSKPIPTASFTSLQRRFAGLAVLLLMVMALSWLLGPGEPGQTATSEGLKTVVVPLSASQDAPPPDLPASAEAAPVASPSAAEPEPAVAASQPTPVREKPAAKPARRWYVLLGAFSDEKNARIVAEQARAAGYAAESSAYTQPGSNTPLTRLRTGPFANEDQAQSARAALIVGGMTRAKVISEP